MKKADKTIPWTLFWDMHSGGYTKVEPYDKIYIEAPQEEAETIFYNRFGRNPNCVTCTCCGPDYSIDESATFEQASGHHRGAAYVNGRYIEKPVKEGYGEPYLTVDQYQKLKTVLVISAEDIKAKERAGTVPDEGYIWH